MSTDAIQLRAMGLGELLDVTFRLYRQRFILMVSIAALALIPTAVVTGAIQISLMGSAFAGNLAPSRFADEVGGIVGAGALLGVVSIIATQLLNGALIFAVSGSLLGQQVTVMGAWAAVFRRLWALVAASLVLGIAVGLMFVTIIGIPFAIFFGLAWSLYAQGIVIEERGIFGSLGRSRELTRGAWWRTLGYAIVLGVLGTIIAAIVSYPAQLMGFVGAGFAGGSGLVTGMVITTAFNAVGQIIATPIFLIGWTLYYYDLRIRKEGFDLEMLARSLET